MSKFPRYLSVVGAAMCLLSSMTATRAHDIEGLASENQVLSKETQEKLQEIYSLVSDMKSDAEKTKDPNAESVVNHIYTWPIPTFRVCFFNGSKALQNSVMDVAKDWTVGTSVVFEYGPKSNPFVCNGQKGYDVRIKFGSGTGSWALLGRSALAARDSEPTVYLSGFQLPSLSAAQRGTVLHEFGHVLGFEHEHQSPSANCDSEFNWSVVIPLFKNEQEAKRNMGMLSQAKSRKVISSEFDAKSVMLYKLNSTYFINGKASPCYIERKNNSLSSQDIVAIRETYPSDSGIRSQLQELNSLLDQQ